MIISVTKEVDGKTIPTAMTVVAPEQEQPIEALEEVAADAGVEGRALSDLLSAFVTHERDGVHLYRTVAARTSNDEWRKRYEEFGAETAEHVQIYEQLIEMLGGDPAYVSPSARMTTYRATKLLESALLSGSVSPDALDLVDLEAVLIAEAKCHENWEFLGELAEMLPEGSTQDAILAAVEEVEDDEDKHLEWARTSWREALTRMVMQR